MPKLAIYIPKKNMKLIEKWRKQVNFSKIFMAALDREVKNRSRKVGTKKEKIAMAAEHYKTRLVEDSTVLVDFGYQLGVDDVLECRLETETINKLLNVSEFDDLATDDIPLVTTANKNRAAQIDQFGQTHGYQDHSNPTWRHAVYTGYLKGVSDAWNKVCEQLTSM
ncbi:MAG: hypothetical protein VB875_15055 [Pirellulales bacterium]